MDRSDLRPGVRLRLLRGHHPGSVVEVVRAPTQNAVELKTLPGGVPGMFVTRGARDYSVDWVLNNSALESEPRVALAHPEPPALMRALYARGDEDEDLIHKWYDPALTVDEVYQWAGAQRGEDFDAALLFVGLPQRKPERAPVQVHISPETMAMLYEWAPRSHEEIAAAVQRVKDANKRELRGALHAWLNTAGVTREAWALAIDRLDKDEEIKRFAALTDGAIDKPTRAQVITDYFNISIRHGRRVARTLPEGFRLGGGYKPPQTSEWALTRVTLGVGGKRPAKQASGKNGPVVQKMPPRPAGPRPSLSLDPVTQSIRDRLDRVAVDEQRMVESVAKLHEDLATQEAIVSRLHADRARLELALEAMTQEQT